jgi:hypothetical protein
VKRNSRPIYLFIGNHNTTQGIGDIIFTLYSALTPRLVLRPTKVIKRDSVNIIIDEFSNPLFVDDLKAIKTSNPKTKYIFVATEFVTSVKSLGYIIAKTFNFFGTSNDWIDFGKNRLFPLIGALPTYTHRRFIGFTRSLELADIIVALHPRITKDLLAMTKEGLALAAAPMTIYPIIGLTSLQKRRWLELEFGFTSTGTPTNFRARMARELIRRFYELGYDRKLFEHQGFKQTLEVVFARGVIKFGYEADVRFIYNLNSPQTAKWPYSSPMRIARAAMLGQIPVLTKRFGDHEIEKIALLWDGKTETAAEMWRLASRGRDVLISRYKKSLQAYNELANQNNYNLLQTVESLK